KYSYYTVSDTTLTNEFPYSGDRKHLFIYPYNGTDTRVVVKGGFNGWNEQDLTLNPDGYWRAVLDVTAGKHEYKYKLNNDDNQHVFDPYNAYQSGNNSYLGVNALATSSSMREITVPQTGDTYVSNWEDTPYAITEIITKVIDESKIQISWNKLFSVEDYTGAKLYYSTNSDTNNFILLITLDKDSNTYIHTGVSTGTIYYYKVYPFDGAGNSNQFSNFASAKPSIPINVTFIVDIGGDIPSTVNLASNQNDFDNKSDSMEYIGNNKWRLTKLLQSDLVYEYKYVLNSAIDAVWEQDIKYTFIYNDSNIYKIQVTGDFNNWDTSINAPLLKRIDGTDTWITEISGVQENSGYKFIINGNIENGNNRITSIHSNNRKIMPLYSGVIYDDWCKLPDPPSNFTGIALSETMIQLTWNLPESNDAREIIGFKLYRSNNSDYIDSGYELLAELPIEQLSYTDEYLNIYDTYYYRIISVETGSVIQDGFWSQKVLIQTQTPVPVTFNVEIKGNKPDTVSWVSSVNDYNPLQDTMYYSGNNIWTITKYLQPGVNYEYKYAVNYTEWEEDDKYVFEFYDSTLAAQKIQIAGNFNNWDNGENAPLLRKIVGTDTWIIEIAGIQENSEYKFIINGEWESIVGNRKIGLSGLNRKILISQNNNLFNDNWCKLPNPPSNISAAAISETSVRISCNSLSGSDIRDIAYYKLYRTFYSNNTNYQFIALLNINDTQYIDNNLNNGATYYYRFTAVETGHIQTEGYFSDRIQATVSKPVNVQFNVDAGKSANISSVRVAGDNPLPGWNENGLLLSDTDNNGIWSGILTNVTIGTQIKYKYIKSSFSDADYEIHSDRYLTVDSSPTGIIIINDNWGDTPSSPVIITDADSGKIVLEWNIPDFDADTYYLYKYNKYTRTYILISILHETSYIDTDVNYVDTYYYKIKVQDGTLSKYESGLSDTASALAGILSNVTFYLASGVTRGQNNIYNFSIAGDFNNWSKTSNLLNPHPTSPG
ncbi:hypothetical protein KA977_13075, partial [Candidatus Dependentiae bacterium]|nr:hypothetical protein [Candidatus Dependentiae bacterium]